MPIFIDTHGVQEVFDAGRKLEPAAVGVQWGIMVALSLVTIFVFSVLRPSNKIVYQPKVKYHVGNKAPPRISSNFFGWIPPLARTKDPELVEKIGIDALVFLHFVRLLRILFLITSIFSCAVLVPIDYVYNIHNIHSNSTGSPDSNGDLTVLTAMSIRDVKGPMLYAHVGLTYFITFTAILLIRWKWLKVIELRQMWFRSHEYLHSLYARTLCITQVNPRYQADQGLSDILSLANIYCPTGVHIGRDVGRLPDMIEAHNDTVRKLERVLVRHLRGGKIGKKRPTIRTGGWCGCFGGKKEDAISVYTQKLRQIETAINNYRANINTRNPTNYGFASFSSVVEAHRVAQQLSNKHLRGTDIDIAPNPRDIIWANITETRGTRVWKQVMGFLWLGFICVLSLVPLFFAATLANLDVITQTNYFPFLVEWSLKSEWTYTIASATLPPLAAGITTFFLPRIMRKLSKYMGAFTRSKLDRAVVARYFAFLVISQLIIFTLIGVVFNLVLDVVRAFETSHTSITTIFSKFNQLPQNVVRTYVNQAAYWLKWFPLRGLLTLIDLTQIPYLIWIPIKTHFFGRTPRDIREWTKPYNFEYAIYYSNLLFFAAVGLLFAPLAPLVALAGAIVFWATSWVFKYQLMYICVTQVETGGRIWNVIVNRLLACLVFMQLLMTLTIALRFNFGYRQTILTGPAIIITIMFKLHINRSYLPRFRYFTPPDSDPASHIHYQDSGDIMGAKLTRRFGHPAEHSELFAPMVHRNMMHLLREVYKGRVEEEEQRPFIQHQGSYESSFSARSPGSPGGSAFYNVPMPTSPSGYSVENMTQVLFNIAFRGINENDLEYDPRTYAQDYGEVDWEAQPPPAYQEQPPSPQPPPQQQQQRQRARLQRSRQSSSNDVQQEQRHSRLNSNSTSNTEYRPPPPNYGAYYHQYPPQRASYPTFATHAHMTYALHPIPSMSVSDSQPQNKPSTSLNTLDSFITNSKPLDTPTPIATSAEIRDRGSTFIANIFIATSAEEALSHTKYVKHVLHANRKATHEIAAWRCMGVKPGCSGLGGPEEFHVVSGSTDDGERWAGDRTLKVMQNLAVIDAVVVVSRWYGGTMLGPSRFNHIETCSAEVCRAFKRSEELRESITTLRTLDVLLEGLREELKALQQQQQANSKPSTAIVGDSESQLRSSPHGKGFTPEKGNSRQDSGSAQLQAEKKKPDYSSVDLAKARRLIKARESAIKWVKDSLNNLRTPASSV
ncbi:hypothetical protein NP233_g1358 [Leucocoprinus birnbaumii]|uniref:DUF221-domain-containing protein n=1 Tax=Leucocoprinus birnbaumii TaxID=56174 RepID=A0AAD5W489_9AGAR|nr:hypothetical protein NP233_g1358 [Leucocoprinus birnbaumii]